MSTVLPFRALRPTFDLADKVASPPYDVMNTEEARAMASGNPHSFLRVVRAEIDFPAGTDMYSDEVYEKGASNLGDFETQGVMEREATPCFYLYQQKMGEHVQTGLVALASCKEYDEGKVRIHEYTRPEKEEDRIRHIATLSAQTGPVFLTYPAVPGIDALISEQTQTTPQVDFVADDGIEHRIWVVQQDDINDDLQALFQDQVPLLYIADGHHRSASASKVASIWQEQFNLVDEHLSQFFLSVIYPHDQMQILPYNRYVHDLNGFEKADFLQKLGELFDSTPCQEDVTLGKREFAMYLDGQWQKLCFKQDPTTDLNQVDSLDVSLLQNLVLRPLLDIEDPRLSKRISFVGGIRGNKELKRLVDEKGGVAFACCATSIEELFAVADANQVMPPKSTWFEPKLRSGLFVHLLEP